MAKARTVYACQACGAQSPRWLGRCPECQGWNTLAEERLESETAATRRPAKAGKSAPLSLAAVDNAGQARLYSGIGELDRVLGGGVVAGSAVLIGGDPGIGKSTLVLQALTALAANGTVLYVSGEESPQQIKMRAARLGGAGAENVLILAETALEQVLEQIEKLQPVALCIDSIQTIFTEDLGSAPGTVGQVRECAARLVMAAKRMGLPTFLIGHVTKEGALAGPRVLEHIVDTVLYFEGDRGHPFRILRAVKNRFGSTNEIGVFEMKGNGLQPVTNPSALFLAERPEDVPGSAVIATMEGTRPILVEVQALVSGTTFGTPRRTTLGIDPNRVALLIAVLEKKMGLHLLGHDIFVNVAGGVRLDEPAADLGVIAAVASSFLDKPVEAHTVLVGEIGLAGEVRAVGQVELRVREALKLGFTRCVIPESSRAQLPRLNGVEIIGASTLAQVWEVLF